MRKELRAKGPLKPLGQATESSKSQGDSYTQPRVSDAVAVKSFEEMNSKQKRKQKDKNVVYFSSAQTPMPFLDDSILERKKRLAEVKSR